MAYLQDRLVTRDEAATRLSVSREMVAKMQRNGELTKVKVGAAARCLESEIDALVAGVQPDVDGTDYEAIAESVASRWPS
jgi:excisionase family DNA binding protein